MKINEVITEQYKLAQQMKQYGFEIKNVVKGDDVSTLTLINNTYGYEFNIIVKIDKYLINNISNGDIIEEWEVINKDEDEIKLKHIIKDEYIIIHKNLTNKSKVYLKSNGSIIDEFTTTMNPFDEKKLIKIIKKIEDKDL